MTSVSTARWLPALLCALASAGCGGDDSDAENVPAPVADIKVLSSRPDTVSGGSALVEVPVRADVTPSAVKLLSNGSDDLPPSAMPIIRQESGLKVIEYLSK